MAQIVDLRIADITITGGTQQRPTIEALVDEYATLMQDGVQFPPIDVIFDGATYWVWDGFHRIEAAKRRGQETIRANAVAGTQRQAIWLSFGANKEHGEKRVHGTVKRIVETILCDPLWSKTPLTQIAKHVGATFRYVSEIHNAILKGPKTLHEDENPTATTENADSIIGTVPMMRPRAPAIEVTRNGTTYSQKAHAPSTDKDPFSRFANRVTSLQTDVQQAAQADATVWAKFDMEQFQTNTTALHALFVTCAEGVPRTHPKRFQKPGPEEVAAYAKSLNFELDGHAFCDFYESKGWVIGRSPMKDWRAAVRTWKKGKTKGRHKLRLLPIPGKYCSRPGCGMPAVYKVPGGQFDHYRCAKDLPEKVKEMYE